MSPPFIFKHFLVLLVFFLSWRNFKINLTSITPPPCEKKENYNGILTSISLNKEVEVFQYLPQIRLLFRLQRRKFEIQRMFNDLLRSTQLVSGGGASTWAQGCNPRKSKVFMPFVVSLPQLNTFLEHKISVEVTVQTACLVPWANRGCVC